MEFFEKTIESEIVYEGRIFTIKKQKVLLPNKKEVTRDVLIHHGGAAVIAIDENRNIKLVRQFRKGAECELLEIPAGKLEENEDPYECCVRELKEETGYVAKKIESLGYFYPTPAYCSEKIYIYMATELTEHEQKLDEDEFLETVTVSLDEAYDMVMSGKITDGKTIIAIIKAYDLLRQ